MRLFLFVVTVSKVVVIAITVFIIICLIITIGMVTFLFNSVFPFISTLLGFNIPTIAIVVGIQEKRMCAHRAGC